MTIWRNNMEGYEIFEKRNKIDKKLINIAVALLESDFIEEDIYKIISTFLDNEIEDNPEIFNAAIDKEQKINELIEKAKNKYQDREEER